MDICYKKLAANFLKIGSNTAVQIKRTKYVRTFPLFLRTERAPEVIDPNRYPLIISLKIPLSAREESIHHNYTTYWQQCQGLLCILMKFYRKSNSFLFIL